MNTIEDFKIGDKVMLFTFIDDNGDENINNLHGNYKIIFKNKTPITITNIHKDGEYPIRGTAQIGERKESCLCFNPRELKKVFKTWKERLEQ